MMTRIPRDKGPFSTTKQEPGLDDGKSAAAAARARPASSRSWPGLKDPRIVRVSRAFGGKDRHSKVSTLRGLRDRRVRLSVQTAIQLYDLQDRLGLNQPSKVVDWLLDAAQHEIDKLPPFQVPPGSFATYPLSMETSHGVGSSHQLPSSTAMASDMELGKDNGGGSLALLPGNIWAGNRDQVEHQAPRLRDPEKDGLFKRIEQHEQHHGVEVIVPVQDNLQRLSFFSMPSGGGGGGGGSNPFASYCILEASMCGYPVPHVEEVPHGYRPPAAAEQQSLSLSHGSQLLLVPSGVGAPPPMFSPYGAPPADHYDPKHVHSVLQMGSSASSQGCTHHHF